MLRSTGFFRGIDCPFYGDYSEASGVRSGCNRPNCHFRHSGAKRRETPGRKRTSSGAAAEGRRLRDLQPAHREQGYDPFNPEVVSVREEQNGKPAASGDFDGALELVNKAIEEVRGEVEREKRKLSRIGDEPYNPCKVEREKKKKLSRIEDEPYNPCKVERVKKKLSRLEDEPYNPCEVREKKKLSRIEDEPYNPSEVVRVKKKLSRIEDERYNPCEVREKKKLSRLEDEPYNPCEVREKKKLSRLEDEPYNPSEVVREKKKLSRLEDEPYNPCEVDRGKKKLSRIEDEPYNPSEVVREKKKLSRLEDEPYNPCDVREKKKLLRIEDEPYNPCEVVREKKKLSRLEDEPYNPCEVREKKKLLRIEDEPYNPSEVVREKKKLSRLEDEPYNPCEVDRGKKKLSRIEDEPYNPSEVVREKKKLSRLEDEPYNPCDVREKKKLLRIEDEPYNPCEVVREKKKLSRLEDEPYNPCEVREKKKLLRIEDEPYNPSEVVREKKKLSRLEDEPYNPSEVREKKKLSRLEDEPYNPSEVVREKKKLSRLEDEPYNPCEVREKKKLSRIEDEPYNPSEVVREKKKLSRLEDEPYNPCEVDRGKKKLSRLEDEPYNPCEVDRGKKKLSRTGDELYNPSVSAGASSSNGGKRKVAVSHQAYDPGSYQITSGGYNPTPGCSKYTLDSDTPGHNSNSMEYVPTSVKKASPRAYQLSSPPPNPKYSNSTSVSKCKYTVDNSRPSTDMEYDPLSNYSAGIAVKSKREETPTESGKTQKLPVFDLSDEDCVVAAKKPRLQSVDSIKYTVSDSDEESSGTEYRPMTLSNLQLKKGNSGSAGDLFSKGRKETTVNVLNALTQRNKEESSQESDTQEDHRRKDNVEKKKVECRSSHEKSRTSEKVHKVEAGVHKSSSSKSSSGSKDSRSIKSPIQDSAKKENKSHGKKDEKKTTVKVKASVRVHGDAARSDGKIKTGAKVKADSKNVDKDTENGPRESKKPKCSTKEQSKNKDRSQKNGKLENSKREKDGKKNSERRPDRSGKATPASQKAKVKQSSGSSSNKRLQHKRDSLNLSHADLFGDESADEADPMEEYDDDDDGESDEVLLRKPAGASKQSRLNKRKASERTPSTSEDEGSEDDKPGADGYDMVDFAGLDFDSDPMEECLRIFNESKDVKREDKGRQAKQACRDSEEEQSAESTLTTLFPGQKKRVSHCVPKGNSDAPSKAALRPYKRPSAQEVCYQRMQMAQQQAAQLSASVRGASQSSSPGGSREKKRIAHRPTPTMTTTSPKTSPRKANTAGTRVLSPSQSHQIVKAQTTAGILSKTSTTLTQKRVAHTPTMKSTSLKRPIIPTEFGAKVPTSIRQRYLNAFIDECVKFCPSQEVAFEMALGDEKLVYDRSSSKNIYLNIAVNTLKKLRSQSSSLSPPPATKAPGLVAKRRTQSHEEVLGGRLAATTSFTLNRMGKQQEEKLTGATLYRKLQAYLMTEEQLQEHGYPRVNPEAAGKAVIHNLPEKKLLSDPFNKICCRCGAEYKINAHGNCVRKEECCFHWGRLRRHKVAGGWETNYSCCSAGVGAPGCQTSKQHVQDGRKESVDGYVSTFSKSLPLDGNGGVFALDCEMCYTKQGLELTRVTVIDSELKVIYDTFVKPESKVVDYNTRFSGVTEEDLENTTITLRDVQAVLLCMFSAESVLIGHSLESDLLALKLIHSSVVDTAIVFPHRLGLPYKRALRNLMADHLKRIIQDNVEGHDSSEDASACMELMFWKIKEDAKGKR